MNEAVMTPAERCAIRVIDRGDFAATKPIPKGGKL